MVTDKESKISIARSLIAASIFLIFLKPLYEIIWTLIVGVSNKIFQSYTDAIYTHAAKAMSNEQTYLVLILLVCGICFSAIFISILLLKRLRRISIMEKIIKEKNPEHKKKLHSELSRVNAPILSKAIEKPFYLKLFIYCYIFLNALLFSDIAFRHYSYMQLNTSFNQRLNAVSPYVSDVDMKKFKSKWALMKTRTDFLSISNEFEQIAKQNNIELPENLLK